MIVFQSTRPRGARHLSGQQLSVAIHVSIHAPSRGATRASSLTLREFMFQSTRPRGARREQRVIGNVCARVSIHAPSRGATTCLGGNVHLGRVSIHAPSRGATWALPRDRSSDSCFNPRALAGRDGLTGARLDFLNGFQSTRPRGARLSRPTRNSTLCTCFNPRALAGRDIA